MFKKLFNIKSKMIPGQWYSAVVVEEIPRVACKGNSVFITEITNMPGHCLVVSKGYIRGAYHINNFELDK